MTPAEKRALEARIQAALVERQAERQTDEAPPTRRERKPVDPIAHSIGCGESGIRVERSGRS